MAVIDWYEVQVMKQRNWACGFCGLNVAGYIGYYKSSVSPLSPGKAIPIAAQQIGTNIPQVLICPNCEKPTFFEGDKQTPGVAFGDDVDHLPPQVAVAYREARNCMSVSAYTASALMSRKLLMNVAASQGATEGLKFVEYIEYLDKNGYIPPNGKAWVNHIRDKGNEATHEIPSITQADARDLITFVEMLLRFVFEFPNRVPKKT